MQKVLNEREKLSATWHRRAGVWQDLENFTFSSNDQYLAFCSAKDWIQDTAESILMHRERGFSNDPNSSYLEFWGVLQAVFILQDAIRELQYSLTGEKDLPSEALHGATAWLRLRNLRNDAVGHPTRRGGVPVKRCVTGRQPKSYDSITLTFYQIGDVWNENLRLGRLLDEFDLEASRIICGQHDLLENQLAS
jgi:hypothetical protein